WWTAGPYRATFCLVLGSPWLYRQGYWVFGLRRHEPKRGIGHFEDVVPLRNDDGDIGGHAGLESQVLVVHTDHHVVGDDIVEGDWSQPDLTDRSCKGGTSIGVHRKCGFLALRHAADIRLAD